MAPVDRPESPPTPGQVREYILSMLDGLSALADGAGDGDTGERMRQFVHGLVAAWSPRPARLRPDGLAAANAEPPPDGHGGPANAP